ncbi:unnamed protein product, partial [Meganyctiphanes norvegica]
DQTRVILSTSDSKSTYANNLPADYINASFIKNDYSKNTYIATQGPKESNDNTIDDFWRMIWQENVACIIMLTNLKEEGKSKDSLYWPEKAQLVSGEFEINILNSDNKEEYTLREFSINRGGEKRKVWHYQFRSWPDHSVPSNPSMLAVMLHDIRNMFTTETCVVHCSAGLGRTGTVLLTLLVLDQIEVTGKLDIPEALRILRGCRSNLVDNINQYRFTHELLLEMLYGHQTSYTEQEFLNTFTEITKTLVLQNQLDKLQSFPKDHTYELASNPFYSKYNRDQNIIPGEI